MLGQLAPVSWAALEHFARALSAFCSVHVTPDHVITCNVGRGTIRIEWQATRARLRLDAGSAAGLQNLRDTLGHLLEEAEGGLADRLEWQAEGDLEGRLPHNFRIAEVLSVTRISPSFMRLRLVAEDLDYLARNGLHIRLLQPRDPSAPVWPRLNRNGRTVWPGATDLHMPVYTIRAIDAAQGWLDVDVYLHGHGRTCAWVQSVKAGAVIGLTGPGGGWLPETEKLCLGGDETALPVIARILECAGPATRGHAILSVCDPAIITPLAGPSGVQVQWLVRRKNDAPHAELERHFTRIATHSLSSQSAITIQFAGEKTTAQAIRRRLQNVAGKLPPTVTCATYWSRRN